MCNFLSRWADVIESDEFRFCIVKYSLVGLMEPDSICDDEQARITPAMTSYIHLILRKELNMWHLEPERKAFRKI